MTPPTAGVRAAPTVRLHAPISLRWKAATAVSVVLLSVAAAVAAAMIRSERRFLLEDGQERADALAETLAALSRDPLLAEDELHLGPIVEALLRDRDVRWAYVVDHEGNVSYHPDTQLIGRPPPDGAAAGPDTLVGQASVRVEDTVVGSVHVGLSTAFVDEAARVTLRGLLAPLAIGTVLGLAAVLLLTEMHVRRIEQLERGVAGLAAGDLEIRAPVEGRDEIARLAVGFNRMVEELREARRDIEQGVIETAKALAAAQEINDFYTGGHCKRVARGAEALAVRLGVEGEELSDLEVAAALHDIGKIGVPAEILSKPGKLTRADQLAMQEHAALGARLLATVSFFDQVSVYVRYHHEDWDGNGYPEGLEGEATPLPSRIIRIVDAYDAMRSSRPYRDALPIEEALRRVRVERGRQFDPRVLEAFLELAEEGVLEAIRCEVDEGEEVA